VVAYTRAEAGTAGRAADPERCPTRPSTRPLALHSAHSWVEWIAGASCVGLERPVGAAFARPVLAEARARYLADAVEEPRGLGRNGGVWGGSGHETTSGGCYGDAGLVYFRIEGWGRRNAKKRDRGISLDREPTEG
jgi:hypothetical protein